jgi:hypothetical protein
LNTFKHNWHVRWGSSIAPRPWAKKKKKEESEAHKSRAKEPAARAKET